MIEILAQLLVALLGLYAAVGLGVAAFLAWRGLDAIDPTAAGGTWGFRLLVFPGCAALWPLLLGRYRRREPPPEPRDSHRTAATSRRRENEP